MRSSKLLPLFAMPVVLVLFACSDQAATEAPWKFTEVTGDAGLASFHYDMDSTGLFWIPESMGAGGGFVDYDGDGQTDIVLVAGGKQVGPSTIPALELYRNRGDGTFERRTEKAGLEPLRAYGQGIYAADYDNDGDQDLFLTTLYENHLLRNDGGTFTDVSDESGLGGISEWSTAAAFFDADHDGHLDLYVANYVYWEQDDDIFCSIDGVTKSYCTPKLYEGTPGRFYRNNGDGTFSDRTDEAGFSGTPGNSLGAVAFDYNSDGLTDLFVANDLMPDLLFRNEGGGRFSEIGLRSGVAFDERGRARAGMGTDAGVIDSTGAPTIFVGNFSHEPIGVYHYVGNDRFVNREVASRVLGLSVPSLTFAVMLIDADLDGLLDVVTVNGHVQMDIQRAEPHITHRQPPHLFHNQGDATFADLAPQLGPAFRQALAGRGGAYADYDEDGDLDLLMTENTGPVHLLRNDVPEGVNYLRVHLEGTVSNRDAVGARLVAYVGERPLIQYRRGGSSYLSTNEPQLTFGLGPAQQVDSLRIYWPSGISTIHRDLPANQEVAITEPRQ